MKVGLVWFGWRWVISTVVGHLCIIDSGQALGYLFMNWNNQCGCVLASFNKSMKWTMQTKKDLSAIFQLSNRSALFYLLHPKLLFSSLSSLFLNDLHPPRSNFFTVSLLCNVAFLVYVYWRKVKTQRIKHYTSSWTAIVSDMNALCPSWHCSPLSRPL